MEIKVETGVPLPEPGQFGGRVSKYPYDDMEVGASFVILATETDNPDVIKRRMRQSTVWANKRYKPKHFIARAIEGGIRVWRDA